MKYFCTELNWTFYGDRLAWTLIGCGLTVIKIREGIA